MAHRNVELFELLALVLDLQGNRKGLDDAIAELARWMELARDRLTDDDWGRPLERSALCSTARGCAAGRHEGRPPKRAPRLGTSHADRDRYLLHGVVLPCDVFDQRREVEADGRPRGIERYVAFKDGDAAKIRIDWIEPNRGGIDPRLHAQVL